MSSSESNQVLEDNKAKLREFIEAGAQLCLTKAKPEHEKPSFHWELDAGQNSPAFKLLGSEFFGAAEAMFRNGELGQEDQPREYMGLEFTRLHLSK